MSLEQPALGAAASVIAALLVGGPIPTQDRAALYDRAAEIVPVVARGGPWDSLRDITLLARRDALAEDNSPDVRAAALRLVSRLESPDTAEALVHAVCRGGRLTPEIEALLSAGGPVSILTIAGAARTQPGTATLAQLTGFTKDLPAESWRKACQQARAQPFESVSGLFPLVAQLPVGLARELGYLMLDHEDVRVRRQVLAFLLGLEPKDAGWRNLVEWGLAAADQELADVARAALTRLDPPDERLVDQALDDQGSTRASGRLRRDLEALQGELSVQQQEIVQDRESSTSPEKSS